MSKELNKGGAFYTKEVFKGKYVTRQIVGTSPRKPRTVNMERLQARLNLETWKVRMGK